MAVSKIDKGGIVFHEEGDIIFHSKSPTIKPYDW